VRAVGRNASSGQLADAVNDLATGASNATGTFTLVPGATVTPVSDGAARLCTPNTRVFLVPRTAAAAASGWWVSAVERGGFSISHPAAAAGCIFDYLIQRSEA
jgi:hypothetical protein